MSTDSSFIDAIRTKCNNLVKQLGDDIDNINTITNNSQYSISLYEDGKKIVNYEFTSGKNDALKNITYSIQSDKKLSDDQKKMLQHYIEKITKHYYDIDIESFKNVNPVLPLFLDNFKKDSNCFPLVQTIDECVNNCDSTVVNNILNLFENHDILNQIITSKIAHENVFNMPKSSFTDEIKDQSDLLSFTKGDQSDTSKSDTSKSDTSKSDTSKSDDLKTESGYIIDVKSEQDSLEKIIADKKTNTVEMNFISQVEDESLPSMSHI